MRSGNMRNFLTFDIGGTLIKYGVITEKGTFLTKTETPTESHLGGKAVLNKVKKIGDQLMESFDISGVCISTAGQVDSKKGEILYASSLLPEYTGMPIKKELETHFNKPVAVENDVNSVGLAEAWIGKGKNTKSMFCLTIGTGIGGSYVIDNKLHTGHSFSGGEIGYIPIEGKEFQELASTRTLVKNVAEIKGIPIEELNGKKIFDAAINGDEVCIEQIDKLVYYLSKGIATIAYIMNPEMIVIGGGITNQKEYLYPLIMKQLEIDLIPAIYKKTKIEIAENLNDAGMIGALRNFLLQESMQSFNRIFTMIDSNKHKLTKGEAKIARYITQNLNDVPNLTISEMAEKINVSESMITRFCKKLEIGSYSKLRLMAKEAIVGTRIHDIQTPSNLLEVKQNYTNILNEVETLNEQQDITPFVEKLTSTNKILLYGTGEVSFVIHQIKYKMMKLGIPVEAFSDKYQMELSKRFIEPDTLVIGISLSGYNEDILHMLEASKKKGAFTVAITSQKDSPISKEADTSFFIPSKEKKENVISFVNEISTLFVLETFYKEMQKVNKNQSSIKMEQHE